MNARRRGVVAIVGRPNVGKSTLFNRLSKSRDAIVFNRPGLTRDRHYGEARAIQDAEVTLIDTGGLHDDSAISTLVDNQVQQALDEAHLVLLVTDAREGLSPIDVDIAQELRKSSEKVVVVANKIDGTPGGLDYGHAEFARLGFEKQVAISAAHGHGMDDLIESVVDQLPEGEVEQTTEGQITVAVIGRPNVGKSSLVNALSSSDRCLVFDEPGTTRDAVHVIVEREGRHFRFIDTAGIRRKGRVSDSIEKFSIVKALDAMKLGEVALLVIDASEGIVEQDLHLITYAFESGCAVILVVNKWDTLKGEDRLRCQDQIKRKLRFANWVTSRFTSAVNSSGIVRLFADIEQLHSAGVFDVSSSALTEILEIAVVSHPPPTVQRRQIKLRYAHKVGTFPPSIMIHGNQTDHLPASYIRYLEREFRSKLGLEGWPVLLNFKTASNPFAGRKNILTERQRRHRIRMIKHRKSK